LKARFVKTSASQALAITDLGNPRWLRLARVFLLPTHSTKAVTTPQYISPSIMTEDAMSDLENLKTSLLADIAGTSRRSGHRSRACRRARQEGLRLRTPEDAGLDVAGRAPDPRRCDQRLKNRVTEAITERKAVLKDAAITARLAAETVDVSLPVRQSPAERGRIHPISQIIDEITAIFGDMGFSIAEGPDIETDYYNFTALNFPEGHPAREMHDTFFFQPDEKGERKVLRTHTSPVQIRTMEAQKPPIRIIIPGKTYRQDSDATHSPMFHQVEGWSIDKQVQCRQHALDAGRILQGLLRGRQRQDALPAVLLPVHRAEPRSRHPVRPLLRPECQVRRRHRLDGDPRLRHGASRTCCARRARSGRIPGLCLGHGPRPHRHAEIRHAGPATSSTPTCAGCRITASGRSTCRLCSAA
jgi:phenylalanyl-tRNA synthetase alpha subunit